MLVLHRKQLVSATKISQLVLFKEKKNMFIARTKRSTQMPFVGRMQSFIMLKQLVYTWRHGNLNGSGGITPRFLSLGTRWSEWSSSRPSRFTPVNRAHPIHRRLVAPKRRSGRFGGEKNFFSLPGIEHRFLGLLTCSVITVVTELYRRQR
jgi:hypothetical protein